MTYELILTSVAQGLDPKERGFCPVAADVEISPRVVQCLSELSCYRHLVDESGADKSNAGPVAYSHFILPGGIEHVLSRVADAGLDYQQKPNILAHHIVLQGLEIIAESPAWLLALPSFHFSEWSEPPLRFTYGRPIPTLTNPQPLTRRQQIARQHRWLDPQKMALTGSVNTQSETYLAAVQSNDDQAVLAASPTTPCPVWQELTGDPGWAGVLAETVFSKQQVVLIYHPGQNILPLFVETLALLPPYTAWQATFCTYFTGLPETISCQWKGVITGSDEAKTLARDLNNLVIDLTLPMREAPAGRYVGFARYGQEYLLPFDDEDYAADFAEADTQSHGVEENKKTSNTTVTPDKIPDSALPAIQFPKRQAGLFESFLRRSSRSQFYILYSIMLVLMLFLLVLAIDQVAELGIIQKLRGVDEFSELLPPAAPEPQQEILSELDKHAEPEEIGQEILTDAERMLKTFEENREKQKEQLLVHWQGFTLPDFLSIHYPIVQENGNIDVLPIKALFGELRPIRSYAAALELRLVPLFELSNVSIKTELLSYELPHLVWEVKAVDPGTGLETPMFHFQWSEAGLEMDWQPEGLQSSYLYETVLSSLGFLQLSIADTPESVILIPLFTPQRENPVKVADLVGIADGEWSTPEYVDESPFATQLWREVFAHFAEKELPVNVTLEVWSEPDHLADTPVAGTLAWSSHLHFEIRTSQQASVQTEERGSTLENITIPVSATASLENMTWKINNLFGQMREELELLHSEKIAVEEAIDQLRRRAFDGDDAARTERGQHAAGLQTLESRRKEIESFLTKLPAAYAEIARNESGRFHYSVWLGSADGKKLLVLTTD